MIDTMMASDLDGHIIEDIKMENNESSFLWKSDKYNQRKYFTGRDSSTGNYVRFPVGKVTAKQWDEGIIGPGDTVKLRFKVSDKGFPYPYFVLYRSKEEIDEENRKAEKIRQQREEEEGQKREEKEKKFRERTERKLKEESLGEKLLVIKKKLIENHPDRIGSTQKNEDTYRELLKEYKKIKAQLKEVIKNE